jgi:hypothetical protein
MNVSKGPGYTIAVGSDKEIENIPRSGICYQILGEGINLVDFAPKLKTLDDETRRLLTNVALRLALIDRLGNLSTGPVDLQFAALKLYLLCTCIDTLANPAWLPFNDWMITRKQKYEISERDEQLQRLAGEVDQITDAAGIVAMIRELYNVYLGYHGTSRKFGQFFLSLPDAVKTLIADAYMLFYEKQNFLDPAVRQAWVDQSEDQRLLAIAQYLYKYRRNDFTHAGKIYQTTWPSNFRTSEEAKNMEPDKRGVLLSFFKDNDPQKEIELTVMVNEDEAFLLRTAIVYHCRGLIGIEDDAEFIQKHAERRRRLLILHNVVDEIRSNWKTYKYYSINWMAYEDNADRYHGIPEFQWRWLEAVPELDLEGYGLVTENLIQDTKTCVSRLKALNEPIRQLNKEFPPLYIRNRREDLRDVPEDPKAKRRAKVQMFRRLQEMHEYRDVRWYLGRLIQVFTGMLHVVPDQGGPKMYGYPAPNYHGWL